MEGAPYGSEADTQTAIPTLPPPDMLGEFEEIVAGRRPVAEAFAALRPSRRLLVVPERRAALEQLVLHATSLRIPVVEVEGGTLTRICGFDGHQGVALVVEPRRWATLDEVLGRARERGEPPFVLVLDSLEDPQNVGTLLRSAEACGVHGVLFPTRRSAPISPAAVKASAGAIEHLLLVPLDDLGGGLVDLRGRGLRIVGADEEAALPYRDADYRGPLALVVGSEAHGISGHIRRRIDLAVRIPMRGLVASLNASVAGSVLLFEAASQRGGVALAPRHQVADAGPVASRPIPGVEPPATAPGSAESHPGNEPGQVVTHGQDAGLGMGPGDEPESRNDAMPTAETPPIAEGGAITGAEPETAGEPEPGSQPGPEPETAGEPEPGSQPGPEPETAGEPGPDTAPVAQPLTSPVPDRDTAPVPGPDRPKRVRRVRSAAIAAAAPTGQGGATDEGSPERPSTRSPGEPTSPLPHEEDLLPEFSLLPERAGTAADAELERASE